MDESIVRLAVIVLPIVLAITLHEAAHGYVALLKGDPTAQRAGRITLNPLRHIDPIGTILVPIVLYVGAVMINQPPILFGWAKPVPVDFSRLRRPKRDMLWVAAAGPAANLAMALGWGLLLRVAVGQTDTSWAGALALMAEAGIGINLLLMVLNLLPMPPLDGGRIMISILPDRLSMMFAQLERYGLPILIVLLATRTLEAILLPMLALAKAALLSLFF
ncbi:MAG: site-2 protease family protein [Gammaproteobacteria bacterium]|jgi:Zn-dependent protease|nr:site-2 protease family protein [Gammaproteobacteria bacterium]MBU0771905.1 site-2 protease family protein [Gammaproteobacteria bacterium]MBU0856074.1 site-2 protease family protein [Gammaproteobacteria bacterium]MBU1846223.1 site-2 protease family protein [Gammaproteobacteria bacterium]